MLHFLNVFNLMFFLCLFKIQLLSTALIANKGMAARIFVKQQGWQELLVRLLIVAPRRANQIDTFAMNPQAPKDNTDGVPLG